MKRNIEKLFSLVVIIVHISNANASGCMSIHLEGTLPPNGTVPMYSAVTALASSGLILLEAGSEGEQAQKTLGYWGAGLAAFYLYGAMMFSCYTVNKDEYQKMMKQKQVLKKQGKVSTDYIVRGLVTAPSRAEMLDDIKRWKRWQRMMTFAIGGANLYFQARIADASRKKGIEGFALFSIISTIGVALWDRDNIWNSNVPRGMSLDLAPVKTSYHRWEIAPHLTYRF